MKASLNILFVEDDEKIRDLFCPFFKGKGHQVREARDGQQAVSAASQQPFDLILMDIKMPKLDGISALQEIRKVSPATKIVLMTGFHVADDLEQMLKQEAIECLRKPILLRDLQALLERVAADQQTP